MDSLNLKSIDFKSFSNNWIGDDFQKAYIIYDMFKQKYNNFSETIDLLPTSSSEFKYYIHTLKGTSTNLYIKNIYTLCQKIETEQNIKKYIEKLKIELANVSEEIEYKITPKIKRKISIADKKSLLLEIDFLLKAFESHEFISRKRYEQFLIDSSLFLKKSKIEKLKNYFDKKDLQKLSKLLRKIKENNEC